jgi:putative membrane protein
MNKKLTGMAAIAVAGLLTAATPALAQGMSTGAPNPNSKLSQMGKMDHDAMSKLSTKDKKFLTDAAQGGMEEVELGRLAVSNAESADVKAFGQRMIDDHSKANDQLKQVAQNKGVSVPTDVSSAQRRDIDKLSKLTGADFDRAYMKMMVEDHKKDVGEFSREAKNGNDTDVKSFASTTLPTLEEHLKMAEDAASKVGVSTTASMSHENGS